MNLNLFTDPWVPVLYTNGRSTEVSVRQALADAHQIRCLDSGDLPVDVALHRLLLAVLHRLAGPVNQATWTTPRNGGVRRRS